MRTHALLFVAALLLAACRGSRAGLSQSGASPDQSAIQVAIASSDFQVGQPRLPIVLYDGDQRVADAQRVTLATFDLSGGTPVPGGWSGAAINYSDYEVPYWVAYPELPHQGFWGLEVEITRVDGTTTQAQFTIEVNAQSSSPAIGSLPPATSNRTLATEPDIQKLTSGFEPNPGLYRMTVADAMASGQPTVITFATPAFCTSQLCAPVVNSVEAVYEDLGTLANFIHLEVYKKFDPLVLADEMAKWGLTTEPWTFVLDSEGRVAGKFGGPLSPRELRAALAPLLP